MDRVLGARHAKNHDDQVNGNPAAVASLRRPYPQTKLVAREKPSLGLRTKYHNQRTSTSYVIFARRR